MTLWRLHLMPMGGADGSRKEKALRAQELCCRYSVLGMGWSVDADLDESFSWDEYRVRYGEVDGSVRRWNEDVEIGDLVWTKTIREGYFLARVTGNWYYNPDPDFGNADIVNVRCVEFRPVDNNDVPDSVRQAFRGGILCSVSMPLRPGTFHFLRTDSR